VAAVPRDSIRIALDQPQIQKPNTPMKPMKTMVRIQLTK